MVDFVDAVMRDAQATWSQVLGSRYQPTRGGALPATPSTSACGSAQSATGPFYCRDDQKVYLDLGFFAELDQQFGAPGDFAQAYVITHELGHHVQNLLGFTERAQQDRRPGPSSASVALELQADCFAGIWGHAAAQAAASRLAELSSSRAMRTKRSAPRRRLATIDCRKWRPAA
jgi:predicted metalloprotease